MPPEKIRVTELDENLEICGEKEVPSTERVISRFSIPENIFCFKLLLDKMFRYVENIEISWLMHEDYLAYEMTNKSRHYFSVDISIPVSGEEKYHSAWSRFRKGGIQALMKVLGYSSWGIGRGIVDRRGQDIFVIELDGMDNPSWSLYMTLNPHNTFGDCWKKAEMIEECITNELLPLISG